MNKHTLPLLYSSLLTTVRLRPLRRRSCYWIPYCCFSLFTRGNVDHSCSQAFALLPTTTYYSNHHHRLLMDGCSPSDGEGPLGMIADEVPSQAPLPRKRGRPRKSPPPDEAAAASSDSEDPRPGQAMVEEEAATPSLPRKRGRPRKSPPTVEAVASSDIASPQPRKRGRPRKSPPETKVESASHTKESPKDPAEKKKKPKKAPAHQVLTTRSALPKLWNPIQATAKGSHTFKVASWNVAGLRAVLKKTPTIFRELVDRHDLDMLCLQETKLQEIHLEDPKLKIREILQLDEDFDGYWSFSTTKKGYSGTAVFLRKGAQAKSASGAKQTTLSFAAKPKAANEKVIRADRLPAKSNLLVPELVSYGFGKDKHNGEGRIITVDLPLCTICNVYVPNAGQKLDRLSYRVDEWDKDLLEFMQKKQKERNVPVMWVGDLNVAHTHLEVWNDGAKHLPKQAGVTAEERASFTAQLEHGFVDSFRHLHPEAEGHYSYWSTRAGNRPVNKGLRLDYFVGHESFFSEESNAIVRDSYMDFEQLGSDHCPVIVEIEFKG